MKLKDGIDKDTAKTIQKQIKELKLKVQASIQGEALRVSGAKKDDLQAVMANLLPTRRGFLFNSTTTANVTSRMGHPCAAKRQSTIHFCFASNSAHRA